MKGIEKLKFSVQIYDCSPTVRIKHRRKIIFLCVFFLTDSTHYNVCKGQFVNHFDILRVARWAHLIAFSWVASETIFVKLSTDLSKQILPIGSNVDVFEFS